MTSPNALWYSGLIWHRAVRSTKWWMWNEWAAWLKLSPASFIVEKQDSSLSRSILVKWVESMNLRRASYVLKHPVFFIVLSISLVSSARRICTSNLSFVLLCILRTMSEVKAEMDWMAGYNEPVISLPKTGSTTWINDSIWRKFTAVFLRFLSMADTRHKTETASS